MIAFWTWFAIGLSLLCIAMIVVHGMILAELRHRIRRLEGLLAPGENPFGWMRPDNPVGWSGMQQDRKRDPGEMLGPADHG